MSRNSKSIFNRRTLAVLLSLLMLAGTPAGAFAVDGIDVNEDTEKTEVIVASSMEELAAEVDEIDSSQDVTSDYAYKSLILEGSFDDEIQAYGADEAYYYDDFYLLKYGSEDDAQAAHDALAEEYGEDAVIPNIPLTIRDEKQSYGWGTDYMNMNYEQTRVSTGADVTIAVIDTGINKNHEIFNGRDIVNAYDFVNGIEGSAVDDNGHGTAVAGLIAESTPDNVKIMPLKALDEDGACDTLTALAAVEYADEKGADIINMSFGGYAGSKREMDLAERIFGEYSPLQICAAGNENNDMDARGIHEFPGELECTVCVGAININDNRSPFSNFGNALDFAAPGEKVVVANYKGGYSTSNGTSFSSPYVAAAAALIKSKDVSLNNSQIAECLRSISKDLGSSGKDKYFGYGCPIFDSEDHSTEPINLGKNVVLINNFNKSYTYNGRAFTQNPTVIVRGKLLKENKDYTISYENNINAGTASMNITGIGLYTGKKTLNYSIEKADNTLSAVGKTAKVKKSKLKKKKYRRIAISKIAQIRDAQGMLTYEKASGSKKLSINKTTGKVTVKKKTKKGTYKMKVRVNAAGNGNYNAATKYVTLKVRVK